MGKATSCIHLTLSMPQETPYQLWNMAVVTSWCGDTSHLQELGNLLELKGEWLEINSTQHRNKTFCSPLPNLIGHLPRYQEWLKNSSVNILAWFGQGLDQNLIENLWHDSPGPLSHQPRCFIEILPRRTLQNNIQSWYCLTSKDLRLLWHQMEYWLY